VRTALVVTASLALALPAAADAHVKVEPTRIPPGASRILVFSAPAEDPVANVVGLELELPRNVILDEIEAKPGWKGTFDGQKVVWSGGRIPPRQFATFSLLVTAPLQPGVLRFVSHEVLSNGSRSITYRPVVVVAKAPAPAAARSGRDSGARTLGKAALAVALAAGAIALLAGFGALYLWLRSPLREEAEQPAEPLQER
jgi:hypothetical protein